MYNYSFEQHEEQVGDIQALTNKVISLLNLRIRINEKENEIDESELNDIEICVGLVCEGTDFKVEHIVKREGTTVSFESDENVIVRFIKALMEHIRAMVKKLKDWKDSIFNRNKLLGAMLLKTEADVVKSYAEQRTDNDVILLTNGFKTFMLKDDIVTNPRQLEQYIKRTGSVIDFYLAEVDPNLFKATENIKNLLKPDGNTIQYVSKQKVNLTSALVETKAINSVIETIHKKINNTQGSTSTTDNRSGHELNHTLVMLGNKTLTSLYVKPPGDTEKDLLVSINNFKLALTIPDSVVYKDYDQIKFDRWLQPECLSIIKEVHGLKDKLERLSNIMKTSIERVEDFHKQTENVLSSVRTADDEHEATAEKAKAQKTLLATMKTFSSIYETVPAQLNEHILSQAFNVLNVIRRHAANVERSKPKSQ